MANQFINTIKICSNKLYIRTENNTYNVAVRKGLYEIFKIDNSYALFNERVNRTRFDLLKMQYSILHLEPSTLLNIKDSLNTENKYLCSPFMVQHTVYGSPFNITNTRRNENYLNDYLLFIPNKNDDLQQNYISYKDNFIPSFATKKTSHTISPDLYWLP